MSKVQIDPNFEKAVLRSDGIRGALTTAGDQMAAKARSLTSSKTIAKGIKVVVGVNDGVLTARINATDFKSGWFEFGTVKMRARPFLQPAALALGYSLTGGRHG